MTNPPFHLGDRQVLSAGLAFVETAARALRGAGRLYLVSLKSLPFAAALEQHFTRTRVRATNGRYNVYEADHPR